MGQPVWPGDDYRRNGSGRRWSRMLSWREVPGGGDGGRGRRGQPRSARRCGAQPASVAPRVWGSPCNSRTGGPEPALRPANAVERLESFEPCEQPVMHDAFAFRAGYAGCAWRTPHSVQCPPPEPAHRFLGSRRRRRGGDQRFWLITPRYSPSWYSTSRPLSAASAPSAIARGRSPGRVSESTNSP